MVAILNSAGTAVATYSYEAWGGLLSYDGTMGSLNPLRYRGYIYDEETGLYYLQSRYYNPNMGRFINADSFVSTGQGILGNNMFAYCENNPVVRIDVSGEFFNTICGAVIGGFVAAFTRSEAESFGQAFVRGATTGAVAGAALDISIATAGTGAIAIAAGGGAAAAALDYAWEQTNKGEEINRTDMAVNIIVGAGLNALFGVAGREAKNAVGNTIKSVGKAIVSNATRNITSNSGKVVAKKLINEVSLNTATSAVQSAFSKIFTFIGSKMLGGF